MPLLQSLQVRVSDQRGHCNLPPSFSRTTTRPGEAAHAYAFGKIDRWARLASIAPRLANAVSHAPGVRDLLRSMLHLASERELPRFAPASFQQWARTHDVPGLSDCDVILWTDTFNNHFRPQTAVAAQRVLESAGCAVELPAAHVCCGRPY